MSHAGHRIVVCGGCRTVLLQCKCMSKDKPVVEQGEVCDACSGLTVTQRKVLRALDHRPSPRDTIFPPGTRINEEKFSGALTLLTQRGLIEHTAGGWRRKHPNIRA